jgi:hypothetical protein
MPALAQALSGALPEAAIRQLMQALGNCQQPLTHRGAVNIQPPATTGAGGLARPGAWKASEYRDLLPTVGQRAFVDMPGFGGGGGPGGQVINTSNNYAGNQFSFPINQEFQYSNYFGGDTFNVAGDSTFSNAFSTNFTNSTLTTSNIFVSSINNTPVAPAVVGGGGGLGGGGGFGGFGGDLGGGGGGFVFVNGGFGGGGGRGGQVATANYVQSVAKSATVSVPHVSGLQVSNTGVTVETNDEEISVISVGEVKCPVIKSASIGSFTAKGTVEFPTVKSVTMSGGKAEGQIEYEKYATATCSSMTGTVSVPSGGDLSGGKASGSIKYDVYDKATCDKLSGSVSLPTGGTFKATPSGISVSGSLGSLEGSVTLDVVTGGSLDSDCKLQLQTESKTFKVNFTGAPSCDVTSQGSVSGGISLTGSNKTAVEITTPVITLSKSSGSASVSLDVTGTVKLSGSSSATVEIPAPKITLEPSIGTAEASLKLSGATLVVNPGTGQAPVTVEAAGPAVTLETGTDGVSFSASGIAYVKQPTGKGELTSGEVDWEEISEEKKIDLQVKTGTLTYLAPG